MSFRKLKTYSYCVAAISGKILEYKRVTTKQQSFLLLNDYTK